MKTGAVNLALTIVKAVDLHMNKIFLRYYLGLGRRSRGK